jgi:hypothetical protein
MLKKLSRYCIPRFAQNQGFCPFPADIFVEALHGGFYDLARADLLDEAEI